MLSFHLVSSSITPAGSVHKSKGALLCIMMSRLLAYHAGSGLNRVQVVLPGFSMRLFCFVQAKTLCKYGCIYFLVALVLVCVDVMVIDR